MSDELSGIDWEPAISDRNVDGYYVVFLGILFNSKL